MGLIGNDFFGKVDVNLTESPFFKKDWFGSAIQKITRESTKVLKVIRNSGESLSPDTRMLSAAYSVHSLATLYYIGGTKGDYNGLELSMLIVLSGIFETLDLDSKDFEDLTLEDTFIIINKLHEEKVKENNFKNHIEHRRYILCATAATTILHILDWYKDGRYNEGNFTEEAAICMCDINDNIFTMLNLAIEEDGKSNNNWTS